MIFLHNFNKNDLEIAREPETFLLPSLSQENWTLHGARRSYPQTRGPAPRPPQGHTLTGHQVEPCQPQGHALPDHQVAPYQPQVHVFPGHQVAPCQPQGHVFPGHQK